MAVTPEVERKAREIVEKARAGRKRTPRWLWIAALIASVVCVGALAIGLLTAGDGAPATPHAKIDSTGGGLGTGLVLGLGAGIVIGSLLAVRKR